MKKRIKDCTALEILSNWETNKENENCRKVAGYLSLIIRNLGKGYKTFDFKQVENDFKRVKLRMKTEILNTKIVVKE